MPSDAPERIGLISSPFGLALWHSQQDQPVVAEYVRADTLAARDAEIARLHERLEDNRVWQINPADPDGPLIRVEVEPGSIPDGIYCRDETIRLQDAQIDNLRAERGKAREALRLAAGALAEAVESDTWTSGFEDADEAREFALRGTSATALRAIVAILPDALDGAPEWVRKAVADTGRASTAVDDRIGADAGGKGGDDAD